MISQQTKLTMLPETTVIKDPYGDVDTLTTQVLATVNCKLEFVPTQLSPTHGPKKINRNWREYVTFQRKNYFLAGSFWLPFPLDGAFKSHCYRTVVVRCWKNLHRQVFIFLFPFNYFQNYLYLFFVHDRRSSNHIKLLFAQIPYLRFPLISISLQRQTRET